VVTDALTSPISDQLIIPPLITSLGLAPKNAGSQRTRSASLPGVTEPIRCAVPDVMAGLIVIFAT
jgi:hypothetical protein